MLAFGLLLAWLAMTVARGTPIGGVLHRAMVAWPARQLSKLSWRAVAPFALVLVLGIGVVWFLDKEAMILFSLSAPELLGWAAMFDIGMLVDVTVAALVVGSTVRLRHVLNMISRPLPRPRARRTRNVSRSKAPANDDEGPAIPYVWAA